MERKDFTEIQCLYIASKIYSPMVRTARTELHFLYSLYRAPVPPQGSYNSTPSMGRPDCTEHPSQFNTAITLLPLLAVRHLQCLSACTVEL